MCVKDMGSVSVLFESNVGLFQGEITSPILFPLFLNDIEMHLQDNINMGITIDQLSIYLVLFSDDTGVTFGRCTRVTANAW